MNPASAIRSFLNLPNSAKGQRAESLDLVLALAAQLMGDTSPPGESAAEAVANYLSLYGSPLAIANFKTELQRATTRHAEAG